MANPFSPAVFYQDPKAALKWLEKAFGFETSMLVTGPDGSIGHAEMTFGDGHITVGGEWASEDILGPASVKSPASLGGVCTQFVRVELQDGLDEHHARAKAAGAHITQAPADQFYGARVYRALDLEGHIWNFSQEVAALSIEEMEKASGLTIRAPGDDHG